MECLSQEKKKVVLASSIRLSLNTGRKNKRQNLDAEGCRRFVEMKLYLPWFIIRANTESKKTQRSVLRFGGSLLHVEGLIQKVCLIKGWEELGKPCCPVCYRCAPGIWFLSATLQPCLLSQGGAEGCPSQSVPSVWSARTPFSSGSPSVCVPTSLCPWFLRN